MLRLLGFLALTFVVLAVLRALPFVGGLAQIPLLGFFLAAMIVSWGLARLGEHTLQLRRQQNLAKELGTVETPFVQGKLGSLMLAQRRYKAAIPLLESARDGEPESAEWHYRLGQALLGERRAAEAAESLKQALAIDAEYAYGEASLRLAEALASLGQHEDVLAVLDGFDRNHGESPESAYRHGAALKALGRKSEALTILRRVPKLAAEAAGTQKRGASLWSLRARLASML